LHRWDWWLPGIPDDDPADVCRGARVTASSSLPDGWVEVTPLEDGAPKPAPMTCDRVQLVAASTVGVRRIHPRLAAADRHPVVAEIELSSEGAPTLSARTEVIPGDFRWVAFDFPSPLIPRQEYRRLLKWASGLSWSFTDRHRGRQLYGSPGGSTEARGVDLIRPLGYPEPVRSAGPRSGDRWRGRSRGRLGTSVAERFGKGVASMDRGGLGPRRADQHRDARLHIFGRFPSVDPSGAATAADYRLFARAEGRRIPLADEKGNWRRFRRHEFAETAAQGLRLEILRAEGRPEARWYEIRAWRNETPAR